MVRPEKLIGATGSALVLALLGCVLLFGFDVAVLRVPEPSTMLVTVPATPPPPRPKAIEPVKARRSAGAASPRNLRNRATPVVAPPPVLRIPPPLVAAKLAGTGAAASAGASDRAGPGQGAGGLGNGSGAGGAGGGDGGEDMPPRLVKGHLAFSDLPEPLRLAGVAGTVGVRYAVETSGRVGECAVTSSSGNAELDSWTCALIQRRFRFDPARDPDGRKVRSFLIESHSWEVRRDSDDER